MEYTVIFQKKHKSVYCVCITLNPDESFLQYMWEAYNVRECDIQFIFEGHPKRTSIFTLMEGDK